MEAMGNRDIFTFKWMVVRSRLVIFLVLFCRGFLGQEMELSLIFFGLFQLVFSADCSSQDIKDMLASVAGVNRYPNIILQS